MVSNDSGLCSQEAGSGRRPSERALIFRAWVQRCPSLRSAHRHGIAKMALYSAPLNIKTESKIRGIGEPDVKEIGLLRGSCCQPLACTRGPGPDTRRSRHSRHCT